ncbi:MAG: hypothetical protein JRI45_10190 [Deltaproteobacteria bacterium]|nr:hypothetical protein [Deltaproteobacteria bacterium]
MPSKKKETLKASANDKKVTKALETLKADLTSDIKEFLEKNPEKSIDDVIDAVKIKTREELQEGEENKETKETEDDPEKGEKETPAEDGEKETPAESGETSEESGDKKEGDAEGKILSELSNTQDLLEKASIESKEKDTMLEKFQEDYENIAKKLASKEKELEEMKNAKFSKRIEELAAKEVALGTQTDTEKRITELKSFSEKTLEQLEHVTSRLIERKKDEPVSNTKRSEELLSAADAGDYKVVIEGDTVWAPDRGTKTPEEIK